MIEPPVITVFSRRATLDENRSYIAGYFERAGYRVDQVRDGPHPLNPRDLVCVQGNFNWFPRLVRQLMATPEAVRPYVVLWHSEPLPLPSASTFPPPRLHLREIAKILHRDRRATDVYTNARRLRQVARHRLASLIVVSTPSRREFLAEQGIESHWVPLGYYSAMGHDLGIDRDIDVLFIGTPDDPRHRRSVKYLRRRGVNVISLGDWEDPRYWGAPRTELTNRAKIFLAIQRNPGKLSGARMIIGMANKALVVAEPMYNSAPFISGRHFVSATLEAMPNVIRQYLANDVERERIAEAGHRFVTRELSMDESIAHILELVERSGGPAFTAKPVAAVVDRSPRRRPDGFIAPLVTR